MLWHQLPILLIFFEIGILWIEYLITKFSNEFLEKTSAVNAIFHDTLLVDKLDGQLVLQIDLLLKDLVVSIFKNRVSINLNRVWVPTIILSLILNQVLEYLGAKTERYRVRNVNDMCMSH